MIYIYIYILPRVQIHFWSLISIESSGVYFADGLDRCFLGSGSKVQKKKECPVEIVVPEHVRHNGRFSSRNIVIM